MVKGKHVPSIIGPFPGSTRYISLREISMLCDVHPGFIDRLIRLGLIDPVRKEGERHEWIFQTAAVPLIKKIIRLRNELGINYSGIGVVLNLLSRIEVLETRIRNLESQLGMEREI
jgi:hypothetical protein